MSLAESSRAVRIYSRRVPVKPVRIAPRPETPFGFGLFPSEHSPQPTTSRTVRRGVRADRIEVRGHSAADEAFWSSQHALYELGLIDRPGQMPVIDPEDGDDDPEVLRCWSLPFEPNCSDQELAELGLRFEEVAR